MRKFIYLAIMVVSLCIPLKPSLASGQLFFMGDPNIGKAVKDFTLDTLWKKDVNLKQVIAGKRAIVFFWATWCPHCRTELAVLSKAAKDLQAKGIVIILVDVGEDASAVEKYTRRNQIDLDVFLDVDSKVSDNYGIIGVPTFYFIDEKGVVKDVLHALPDAYESVFQG